MKYLIISILITFLILSCKDESPAEIQIETQYTLEELENDTNWVEVTDYELLDIPCLKVHELEEKYYFQNDEDYQKLNNYFYENSSCTFNTLPEINFNEDEVIGVSYIDSPLYTNDEFLMKVFFNSNENVLIAYCETKYYLDSNDIGRNQLAYMFRKWIKKSKHSLINEINLIYISNLKE